MLPPTPPYSKTVFINCPFDVSYLPFFHAIIFTVYRCGFTPRSALEADDSSENRMDKIVRIIQQSKYGIHDLSKIELDTNDLPRFNMPFEYGLFLGAKKYGDNQQKEKIAIVFEADTFSSKKYLSDISGSDLQSHHNKQDELVKKIRDWLHAASRRKTIPSFQTIKNDFEEFKNAKLPIMLKENNTTFEHLTFNDYCIFVETALKAKLDQY